MLGKLPHDRVAIAGDWHLNADHAARVFAYAADQGAAGILQLGDFGIWPGKPGQRFLGVVDDLARRYGLWVAFVDGNHDDHWQLRALPVADSGVRHVSDHVVHLPRGYRRRWDGLTWLALGGASLADSVEIVEGLG
jgi:hypothetical protein